MLAHLADAGFDQVNAAVELAPPASEDAIAAVLALAPSGDLSHLADLWRTNGGGRWRLGERVGEVLSPEAVGAGARDDGTWPLVRHDGADYLVLRDADEPCAVPSKPRFRYRTGASICGAGVFDWERGFLPALFAAHPELQGFWAGQRPHDGIEEVVLRKDDATARATLDPEFRVVSTWTRKGDTAGSWWVKRYGTEEETRKVFDEAGDWLLTASSHDGTWPHWEMHPQGEEIVLLLSGRFDFELDLDGERTTLELRDPSTTCSSPAGPGTSPETRGTPGCSS